jgi:anti-anti-sigma factor
MIDTDWSPQTSPCSFGTSVITVALSRPQPDTTVCTGAGAVDWNTTPLVRDALTEARRDDNVHLVIDLSAVTSMDSAGPYTLLEARFKHHIGGGGHLAVIADPDSHAIPELQIVALKASFDFHANLADALHACASADTSTGH